MARERPKSQICPSMVACDGADLAPHRQICGACEKKLARMMAGAPSLRGENYKPMSKSEKRRRKAQREQAA